MQNIIAAVLNAIPKAGLVEVEVSARHVHLTQDDVEALFGPGMTLTPKRPLSQPGQFLCEERVTLVGPRGRRERVAVLGPIRAKTQIELSASDCVELGVKAPVRLSGDVDGSGPIRLEGPKGSLDLTQGVIIAHNHIHLTPETAEIMELQDQQHVAVEMMTSRPLVFEDVIVRVSRQSRNKMHIDFDEANAAQVSGFTLGRVVRK
jgi:Propanediol utilization protein